MPGRRDRGSRRAAASGRCESAPRSRCRRRRARRSRGPARLGRVAPRAARRALRALAAEGKCVDDALGGTEGLRRPPQLALHPAAAGKGPLRHDDRLATVVVEGSLGEPALDEVDELAVAQRVPDPRRDLVDRRAGRVRAVGGDGDERRDDEIDGDDVDDAFGHARELAEQAPGVGDDDGLGHPEAPDPSRARLGERGLDDRGPDEGHGQLAPARRAARSRRATS